MVKIPEDELVFKFSRSSGPGGQNVNKVNTKVTLLFNVANSRSFSSIEKQQILQRLAARAGKDGVIRVVSQHCRTQKANRTAAVERLSGLFEKALQKPPVRKKTIGPEHARRKRLEEKKKRSLLKKQRAGKKFEF